MDRPFRAQRSRGMVNTIIKKIIGTQNQRTLRKLHPVVAQINALEPGMKALADADFPRRTAELRAEVDKGRPLDSVLPEAFALCREASRRATDMRHFDVQLIGGSVLHQGRIPGRRTREGKTRGAGVAP